MLGCSVLNAHQLVIIGVWVCCPNRLVNYFQEIARLLALEEATLSTDLQQGYALKSLTGMWWHQRKSRSRIRDGSDCCSITACSRMSEKFFAIVSIGFLLSI